MHARHGRDGLQGARRSRDASRARHPVHRSHDASDEARSSAASSRSARRRRNRCASCSTRPRTQDANGLANSSGMLGKGLMTHFSDSGATGELTDFPEMPALGGAAATMLAAARPVPQPAWRSATKGFLRGYGTALTSAAAAATSPRPGSARRTSVRSAEPRASQVNMQAFGECLRYEDNYCDVDPRRSTPSASRLPVFISRHARTSVRCRRTWPWRPRRCWSRRRAERPPVERHARSGPRARRRANGQRSEDVGVQPVPADPRHQAICS